VVLVVQPVRRRRRSDRDVAVGVARVLRVLVDALDDYVEESVPQDKERPQDRGETVPVPATPPMVTDAHRRRAETILRRKGVLP
jgi:hypothetical protein